MGGIIQKNKLSIQNKKQVLTIEEKIQNDNIINDCAIEIDELNPSDKNEIQREIYILRTLELYLV